MVTFQRKIRCFPQVLQRNRKHPGNNNHTENQKPVFFKHAGNKNHAEDTLENGDRSPFTGLTRPFQKSQLKLKSSNVNSILILKFCDQNYYYFDGREGFRTECGYEILIYQNANFHLKLDVFPWKYTA